ncbi:UNVERIFIED_CONTAM: hypothetical protein PYX00_011526 [Menopon gallinae]|uniref:Phosphoglycerate kinase n=1 Tax=Menopon gallinae TaxID=328185 RepID=A0AAW2H7Y6_9NEOP
MSISDVDLRGKRVFLRADFNVPILDGVIQDDYKIKVTLPTIQHLLNAGVSKLVIGSHLGRPKGRHLEELSLHPVVCYLNTYVSARFVLKSIGEAVTHDFALAENLRFHREEVDGYGDLFVRHFDLVVVDAFGCIHRKAMSIVGTGLPCVMGLLMKKEIEVAERLGSGIDLCILGGSKVGDKLRLISQLKKRSKHVWIVGAMCFTILKDGYMKSIGSSRYEENAPVREIIGGKPLSLPVDFVVKENGTCRAVNEIQQGQVGVDIGEKTLELLEKDIFASKTIFWNGPPGIFEEQESSKGTMELVRMLMRFCDGGGVCIVGGGDTASAVRKFGDYCALTHVSTGGGSLMTLLEGGSLPGVDAIENK